MLPQSQLSQRIAWPSFPSVHFRPLSIVAWLHSFNFNLWYFRKQRTHSTSHSHIDLALLDRFSWYTMSLALNLQVTCPWKDDFEKNQICEKYPLPFVVVFSVYLGKRFDLIMLKECLTCTVVHRIPPYYPRPLPIYSLYTSSSLLLLTNLWKYQ